MDHASLLSSAKSGFSTVENVLVRRSVAKKKTLKQVSVSAEGACRRQDTIAQIFENIQYIELELEA